MLRLLGQVRVRLNHDVETEAPSGFIFQSPQTLLAESMSTRRTRIPYRTPNHALLSNQVRFISRTSS